MVLEKEPRAGDQVFETDDIRVVVDPFSASMLDGSQIDFVDSLMGGGFAIQNPNAVKSCGCGQSFRTADRAGSPEDCKP